MGGGKKARHLFHNNWRGFWIKPHTFGGALGLLEGAPILKVLPVISPWRCDFPHSGLVPQQLPYKGRQLPKIVDPLCPNTFRPKAVCPRNHTGG